MVAALFVEANGCYANLPDVDAWDVTRDARKYNGPWPCLAHPPLSVCPRRRTSQRQFPFAICF